MAHVSILGDAQGVVANANIPEGTFVVINASGVHGDLPVVSVAASGTVTDVYVLFATPDYFPRPTPNGMFSYPDTTSTDPRNATDHFKTTDFETAWLIGPSVLPAPTVASGWKGAAHRGGYYRLEPGQFNDSAQIRVNGAKIMVGASGLAAYTASTGAIGSVREWNPVDGSLTIYVKDI